jgi:hypothetical protein
MHCSLRICFILFLPTAITVMALPQVTLDFRDSGRRTMTVAGRNAQAT